MILAAIDVLTGAGLLIYPLGTCSLAAAFIVVERAIYLRRVNILPADLVDAVNGGRPLMGGRHTALARIVEFAEKHFNEEAAVKAFARLEVNRMMRGVSYLEIIYAIAPLLGLTGTVTGLLRVFSLINPETGMPDMVPFTKGIALALSATLIGLSIAIPSLMGAGYLQRKVENYAAELEVLLERMVKRGAPRSDLAKEPAVAPLA